MQSQKDKLEYNLGFEASKVNLTIRPREYDALVGQASPYTRGNGTSFSQNLDVPPPYTDQYITPGASTAALQAFQTMRQGLATTEFYFAPVTMTRMFMATPCDTTTYGGAVMFRGRISDITIDRFEIKITVTSLMEIFTQKVPSQLIEPGNRFLAWNFNGTPDSSGIGVGGGWNYILTNEVTPLDTTMTPYPPVTTGYSGTAVAFTSTAGSPILVQSPAYPTANTAGTVTQLGDSDAAISIRTVCAAGDLLVVMVNIQVVGSEVPAPTVSDGVNDWQQALYYLGLDGTCTYWFTCIAAADESSLTVNVDAHTPIVAGVPTVFLGGCYWEISGMTGDIAVSTTSSGNNSGSPTAGLLSAPAGSFALANITTYDVNQNSLLIGAGWSQPTISLNLPSNDAFLFIGWEYQSVIPSGTYPNNEWQEGWMTITVEGYGTWVRRVFTNVGNTIYFYEPLPLNLGDGYNVTFNIWAAAETATVADSPGQGFPSVPKPEVGIL